MKQRRQTVAKPLIAAVWVALSLLAVACSQVSSEQADRPALETSEGQSTETAEPANPAPADAENEETPDADDQSADGSDDEAESTQSESAQSESTPSESTQSESTQTGERGSRNLGDAEGELVETPTVDGETTSETSETTEPAEPTVEPVAAPSPTPVATTPPIATAEPVQVAAVATPVPTATPLPTVAPVFVSPQPSGPVPSDDIVITGPEVDESESSSISDNGATACALVESAIEFLDFGDLGRVSSTLREAAGFARQSSEPEIAGTAAALSAGGGSEETATAAIIAALQACAVHGYQV